MRSRMAILRNTNEDAGDRWYLDGFGNETVTARDAAAAVAKAVELLDGNGKIVLQVIEFPNMDGSDFGLLYQPRSITSG